MERPKLGIEISRMLQRPSLEFMGRNRLRPAVARAARTGPGRGTPDSPGVWEFRRRDRGRAASAVGRVARGGRARVGAAAV